MTNDEISNIIEKKFQKAPFYYDYKLFIRSWLILHKIVVKVFISYFHSA
jgi:hypothetical protein